MKPSPEKRKKRFSTSPKGEVVRLHRLNPQLSAGVFATHAPQLTSPLGEVETFLGVSGEGVTG